MGLKLNRILENNMGINNIILLELNKGEKVAFSGQLPTGAPISPKNVQKILQNNNPGARSLINQDVANYAPNPSLASKLAMGGAKSLNSVGTFIKIPGGANLTSGGAGMAALGGSGLIGAGLGTVGAIGGGLAPIAAGQLVSTAGNMMARKFAEPSLQQMQANPQYAQLQHNQLLAQSSPQNQVAVNNIVKDNIASQYDYAQPVLNGLISGVTSPFRRENNKTNKNPFKIKIPFINKQYNIPNPKEVVPNSLANLKNNAKIVNYKGRIKAKQIARNAKEQMQNLFQGQNSNTNPSLPSGA